MNINKYTLRYLISHYLGRNKIGNWGYTEEGNTISWMCDSNWAYQHRYIGFYYCTDTDTNIKYFIYNGRRGNTKIIINETGDLEFIVHMHLGDFSEDFMFGLYNYIKESYCKGELK